MEPAVPLLPVTRSTCTAMGISSCRRNLRRSSLLGWTRFPGRTPCSRSSWPLQIVPRPDVLFQVSLLYISRFWVSVTDVLQRGVVIPLAGRSCAPSMLSPTHRRQYVLERPLTHENRSLFLSSASCSMPFAQARARLILQHHRTRADHGVTTWDYCRRHDRTGHYRRTKLRRHTGTTPSVERRRRDGKG